MVKYRQVDPLISKTFRNSDSINNCPERTHPSLVHETHQPMITDIQCHKVSNSPKSEQSHTSPKLINLSQLISSVLIFQFFEI